MSIRRKEDAITERNEMIRRMKERLDDLDTRISEARDKLQKTGDEAREGWQRAVQELERMRDQMRETLRETEAQSESTWKTARERTIAAWESVGRGMEDALDRLRGRDGNAR